MGKYCFWMFFFGKHRLKSWENRHIIGTSARNIGFHGENHRKIMEFSSMHSFKLFQVARKSIKLLLVDFLAMFDDTGVSG